MPLPTPEALARRLLGRSPDEIVPLVVWEHRATFRCTIGGVEFVCKADEDLQEIARETDGLRRATAAGIAVPEIVAAEADALAIRWVAGTALTSDAPPTWWQAAGRELRRIHDATPSGLFGGGFMPARDSWLSAVRAEVEEELSVCVHEYGLRATRAEQIQRLIADATPALIEAPCSWLHGDLQPDHVIIDPATEQVAAIIDWSDQGAGDGAWDLAVLTLDDDFQLHAFLTGYDAETDERERLTRMLPLYRLVRWLGEIRWLTEHGMTDAAAAAQRSLTENCPPRATSGQ